MAIQHTPTEWRVKNPAHTNDLNIWCTTIHAYPFNRVPIKGHRTILSRTFGGTKEISEANATLICDAVNNTAGKGIDPNAVPELLKVLSIISQHAYDDDTPKEDILADFDNMRGLAINAIKSAELK